MPIHLDSEELMNKAKAVVDAEERGEVWQVSGLSPMSRIRLDARAEHERRTRQAVRRLHGRKSRASRKSGKSGKSKKSGKSGKSRRSIR